MGVRRSDYVLLGFEFSDFSTYKSIYDFFEPKFDNGELDEDDFYDMSREVGQICYLEDGMSSNYSLIGVPLFIDKDGYNGISLFKYDSKENYIDYINLIIKHSKDVFNININIDDINLIVLTHWR